MGDSLNPRIKAFVLRNKIALGLSAIFLLAIAYSGISSARERESYIQNEVNPAICAVQKANGVPINCR